MGKISRSVRNLVRFTRAIPPSAIAKNQSAWAEYLRGRFYRTDCLIDTDVIITNRDGFSCGPNCALYHGTYVLNRFGSLTLGRNSHLGAMCFVNVWKGKITIGDDVAVGPHTSLIVYSNGYARGKKVTDERVCADIQIGDNVFIGANCAILPGTVIEDNVVVGAGAVVKGLLRANTMYAGVPCKPIRENWFAS